MQEIDSNSAVLFTLCEGDYHLGVAALINSAFTTGFRGRVVVGHRGSPPPWIKSPGFPEAQFRLANIEVETVQLSPSMHFGYYKPFFARELASRFPNASAIIYADPDVLFLAPWSFFEDWIVVGNSVALCADQNFVTVSSKHPWRRFWTQLLKDVGFPLHDVNAPYINSGFVGASAENADLWSMWCEVTEAYRARGGDVSRFQMGNRWQPVVGDQDLLAATLMAFPGQISLLGPEGMGFTGDFKFLCHVVEHVKPWRNGRTLLALRGNAASAALRVWRRNSGGPIKVLSAFEELLARTDLFIAMAISRVYRRS